MGANHVNHCDYAIVKLLGHLQPSHIEKKRVLLLVRAPPAGYFEPSPSHQLHRARSILGKEVGI